MPDISQVHNRLYGIHEIGNAGSLSTPTITEIHFNPGELDEKEKEHARATACVQYVRLVWYVKEMRKTDCTYKEAVIKVNKRIKRIK